MLTKTVKKISLSDSFLFLKIHPYSEYFPRGRGNHDVGPLKGFPTDEKRS